MSQDSEESGRGVIWGTIFWCFADRPSQCNLSN